MKLMSAYVKNSWLITLSFIYFGYNCQISITLFFSDNKRLCEEVCGILDMMVKDCKVSHYTLTVLPRDIKKTFMELSWS